jgi:pimeloyl-ACP methyl ester carboxylesterase
MIRKLANAVAAILIGLLLAAGAIYLLQDRMIYHPRPYGAEAENVSTRPLIRINYHTSAGDQVAFYAAPAVGGVPERLWIMFGGNGGLILEYHHLIEQPELANAGILMVDYPGYGYNQGHPSGATIQESANAAVAALAARLDTTPAELLSHAGVIGHSLGTGPALELAVAHPEIRRVLLVAPFTSLYDMCYRVVGPIAYLLHHNFDNEARLRELSGRNPCPAVAIFTGSQDQVIPVIMSRKLKAEFPWVTYVEKPAYEHNHIVTDAAPELAALLTRMDDAPAAK